MAIQLRRGNYEDLDVNKLLDGEIVTVMTNDPNTEDGTATYVCYGEGRVHRLEQSSRVGFSIPSLNISKEFKFTNEGLKSPQYARHKDMVEFRAEMSGNIVLNSGTEYVVTVLPKSARPAMSMKKNCITSKGSVFILKINTDGNVTITPLVDIEKEEELLLQEVFLTKGGDEGNGEEE